MDSRTKWCWISETRPCTAACQAAYQADEEGAVMCELLKPENKKLAMSQALPHTATKPPKVHR